MNNTVIDLSVIVPLGSGAGEVETFVRKLSEFVPRLYRRYEIIIFDDHRQENTSRNEFATLGDLQDIHCISDNEDSGYGRALYKAIQTSRGGFLLTVDRFEEVNLADLLVLHRTQQTSKADFVNGYRVRSQRPYFRIRTDPLLNQIASYFFKLQMRDYACPVKLFNGDLARSMTIEGHERRLVLAEITLKLHALGGKVSECAVVVHKGADRPIHRKSGSRIKEAYHTWLFLSYLDKKIKLFEARVLQSL